MVPEEKEVCYRSPERIRTTSGRRNCSPAEMKARRTQQLRSARALSTPLSFRNKFRAKAVLGKQTMFSDPHTLKLASSGIPISGMA